NGTFVVFASPASNLGGGSFTNPNTGIPQGGQIYIANMSTPGSPTFELVSRKAGGTATEGCSKVGDTDNGFCNTPQGSRDGTVVVFSSSATDLVTGFTRPVTSSQDVFVATKVGGLWTSTLVSHNSGSSTTGANNSSGTPGISPDGQLVVFQSSATDMVSQ